MCRCALSCTSSFSFFFSLCFLLNCFFSVRQTWHPPIVTMSPKQSHMHSLLFHICICSMGGIILSIFAFLPNGSRMRIFDPVEQVGGHAVKLQEPAGCLRLLVAKLTLNQPRSTYAGQLLADSSACLVAEYCLLYHDTSYFPCWTPSSQS